MGTVPIYHSCPASPDLGAVAGGIVGIGEVAELRGAVHVRDPRDPRRRVISICFHDAIGQGHAGPSARRFVGQCHCCGALRDLGQAIKINLSLFLHFQTPIISATLVRSPTTDRRALQTDV